MTFGEHEQSPEGAHDRVMKKKKTLRPKKKEKCEFFRAVLQIQRKQKRHIKKGMKYNLDIT